MWVCILPLEGKVFCLAISLAALFPITGLIPLTQFLYVASKSRSQTECVSGIEKSLLILPTSRWNEGLRSPAVSQLPKDITGLADLADALLASHPFLFHSATIAPRLTLSNVKAHSMPQPWRVLYSWL